MAYAASGYRRVHIELRINGYLLAPKRDRIDDPLRVLHEGVLYEGDRLSSL